jgi:uncharacterized membrane protein
MNSAFWLILRWMVAGAVGALVVISAMAASVSWKISLLAGWDAALLAWLILTGLLLRRSTRMSVSAQTPAPRSVLLFTLVIVTILSLLGLVGASVLAGRASRAEQALRFALAAAAIGESWLLVHTECSLQYRRLSHENATADRLTGGIAPHQGLRFAQVEAVSFWEFMYYSYPIARRDQGLHGIAATPEMRRLSAVQSIISFAFVAILIGFAVNAIDVLLNSHLIIPGGG